MNKDLIITVIGVLIVAGLSFYCGIQYEKNSTPQKPNAFQRQGGLAMNPNRQGQGGMVSGEIISKEGDSLTVKVGTGGSKIVLFSDKTKVYKSVDASADELANGTGVMVTGSPNQDGSVTAQMIQVRNLGDMQQRPIRDVQKPAE